MDRPSLTDLPQLSSWLRYNKLSCEDVVTGSLDAIAGSTDIFTYVSADQATAAAQNLDKTRATHSATKPLAGLTFAAQEVISIDGHPGSSASNTDLADLVPPQGPLVRKLRDLGAVPVGKTASSEFSYTLHSFNRTLPPNIHYDGEPHVAGGSASAIAVAQDMCSFALGSDSAGITRTSAALAGVTGFRPGTDFWSRDGVFPLSRELDAIGLITKKAADLAFLLQAIGAGPAPEMSVAKLRLGIAQKPFYANMDPVVTAAMTSLLDRLKTIGSVLMPIVIPEYDALKSFTQLANGTGLVRYIGRERTERLMGELDAVTQVRIRPGMDANIADIQKLFDTRRILANRINSNLSHIDALIMPTLPSVAVPVSSFTDAQAVVDWQAHITSNIHFASLFNMAAITIPVPASEPVGLQLVAPAGNEVKLVGVARAIEDALKLSNL